MTGFPSRRIMRWCIPVLFVFLFFALPVPGAPSGPRDDLFKALDLERASGRYEEALVLYRKVEKGPDLLAANEARLGEARCLVALGKKKQARRVLDGLLRNALPPELRSAAEAERARLASPSEKDEQRLLDELARANSELQRLKDARTNEEGSREELEKKLKAKEKEVQDLTDRLNRTKSGATDTEARELARRRRLEKQEELAAYFLSQAKSLYREGRFDEAREWVNRAIESDPANEDAIELRRRLGDAADGRTHLVRKILDVLDLERRLRLDEIRAEVDAGIAAGEDFLLRGRPDDAVARASECLERIDSVPSFATDLVVRKRKVRELYDRAVLRGGHPGAVPVTPVPESPREATLAKLDDLLARLATSDRPGALKLRVYPIKTPSAPGRPDPEPGTFALAARRPPVSPLMAALVPVLVHPPSFKETGNFVRDLGDGLAVYAPEQVQEGVSELVRRVAARQDPPVNLSADLLSVNAADLAAASGKAKITYRSRGGLAFSTPAPRAARALAASLLEKKKGTTLGTLSLSLEAGAPFRAVLDRSVNLTAPRAGPSSPELRRVDYGFTLDGLAVRTARAVGLSFALSVSRLGRTIDLPAANGVDFQVPRLVHTEGAVACRIAAGGTLLLAGLPDPFSRKAAKGARVLVLLVRIRAAKGSAPAAPSAKRSEGPAPVAVDLAGLDSEPADCPAPPFLGERSSAEESRSGFLLRYLWAARGKDLSSPESSLTLTRGVVWVKGDDALVSSVKKVVSELAATRDRLVTLEVGAAALTPAEEGRLLTGLPGGGKVLEGEGVRTSVLSADRLNRSGLGYYLAGDPPGRIPLPDQVVARPTQLVSVSRILRIPFLGRFRSGKNGQTWPEYRGMDEGIALEFRPVLLPGNRVETTVRVRTARILTRTSSSDGAVPQAPVQTISVARARATLLKGQALLLSGLAAPTPVKDRRDRMVVLVTLASVTTR